jgi:eukaryotic-like serine/threonine-protein kinase
VALIPGDHIGHYEISSLLGSGGMGEVYRAHDSRLRRAVAIKVLPESVAADRDRLERFQREATTLASLNHPNIAQVYGLEQVGGSAALVMELIEGEELSRRIGHLSITEALRIAAQIASALEAAHAAGVIHRDLKPANIMIRRDGTVRILDFGLAKVENDAASPTLTTAGLVLGTVAYMAPEQARGQTVDKRCDIWAFGCVLYELITGRRVFDGQSAAETIAAVLEREPDWSALPPGTPSAVRALLKKCLQKDRLRRLRDIGDAHFDLDDTEVAGSGRADAPAAHAQPRSSRVREAAAWTAAVVAVLAIGVTSFRPSALPEAIHFEIAAPPAHTFGALTVGTALSPDGRHIAVVAGTQGAPGSLWIRALNQAQATRVAGTEGATTPFWSPDGTMLAFIADDRLMRTDLAGTAPQQVARVAPGSEGGSWSKDGTILIGGRATIVSVPLSGGTPVAVTKASREEGAHQFPVWLPDQEHFLYHTGSGGVFVGAGNGGAPRPLLKANSKVEFVTPDLLVFVQGQDLMAQRIDVSNYTLRGAPATVAPHIRVGNRGRAAFGASSGALLYRNRPASGEGVTLQVLDSTAKPVRDLPIGQVRRLSVSHDGRFIAVHAHETNTPSGEVWVADVRRRTVSRVGIDGAHFDHPVWSPDGAQLVVASGRGLFRVMVAAGTRELVYDRHPLALPTDWTLDGKWIVFSAPDASGNYDLWSVPTTGSREPQPLAQSAFEETDGVVSPDGRWLAYLSNETGRREVYVQPFPGGGRKFAVSVGGAAGPRWDDQGRLYYWSADRRVLRVAFHPQADDPGLGEPEAVFAMMEPVDQNFQFENGSAPYAVLPRGEGYVRVHRASSTDDPLHVVLNWRTLLTWRD